MIKSYKNLIIQPFSKGEIRRAGSILRDYYFQRDLDQQQKKQLEDAQTLVQYWRYLHLYPINTLQKFFRDNLRELGYKDQSMIGQRLKKIATISNKLRRISGKLDSFQDIGGIRIILENIEQIDAFVNKLEQSKSKHIITLRNNYIQSPKESGYRGIHYVCEALSQKAPEQLKGLKIELQLRTLLQHYWATAVESVGMFYGESIKTGDGSKMWNEFFLAASTAFACMENLPLPAAYENYSKTEIKNSLVSLENQYSILPKLQAIQSVSLTYNQTGKIKFVSLIFYNQVDEKPRIEVFPHEGSEDKAIFFHKMIEQMERDHDPHGFVDAVLVKADTKHLKKVYSNYFLEINDFMENLDLFLSE